MPTLTLTLGGKPLTVAEPVFGKLRRIVPAYNQLTGGGGEAEQIAALAVLSDNLLGGKDKWQRFLPDELAAFLAAIPPLCGLEVAKPGSDGDHDGFGGLYAHLAQSLGWTYDYIDQHMTMSRLKDMTAYFNRNPPTHQLVAAYLGYQHQPSEERVKRFFEGLRS